MKRAIHWMVWSSAAVLLAACGGGEARGCAGYARMSLQITVTDRAGHQFGWDEYEVTYIHNGQLRTEFCSTGSCLPDPIELTGDFEVTVHKPGYQSQTQSATVHQGVCNVEPEALDFVLEVVPD